MPSFLLLTAGAFQLIFALVCGFPFFLMRVHDVRERERDTIAANALAAREISPNAERILRTVFCARVLCWRLSRQLLFNFVYYGMRARLVFNLG